MLSKSCSTNIVACSVIIAKLIVDPDLAGPAGEAQLRGYIKARSRATGNSTKDLECWESVQQEKRFPMTVSTSSVS